MLNMPHAEKWTFSTLIVLIIDNQQAGNRPFFPFLFPPLRGFYPHGGAWTDMRLDLLKIKRVVSENVEYLSSMISFQAFTTLLL